jgi:cyclase
VTRTTRTIATLVLACALAFAERLNSEQRGAPSPNAAAAKAAAPHWGSNGEINSFHVQGQVHLLVGAGGNIAVQAGDEGVLVVDTGLPQHAEKVLAAVRTLSSGPIRYIVNTHFHEDHTGGNAVIAKAGGTTNGNPTPIVAYENVLLRMSARTGERSLAPTIAWPTSSYVTRQKDFFFNDEPIVVYHDDAAHTDGDSVVLFRRSDVIMAGDVFNMTSYPVIDRANGGGVQGVIAALNRVLDLAVPKHQQEGGTYVVPGHGRVTDEAEVLEYRDMVTIVRDRIKDAVARGRTLEQTRAERPTLDYDLAFGSASGSWTTAMFVEAIYRDLGGKQ